MVKTVVITVHVKMEQLAHLKMVAVIAQLDGKDNSVTDRAMKIIMELNAKILANA